MEANGYLVRARIVYESRLDRTVQSLAVEHGFPALPALHYRHANHESSAGQYFVQAIPPVRIWHRLFLLDATANRGVKLEGVTQAVALGVSCSEQSRHFSHRPRSIEYCGRAVAGISEL